ncbi:DUF1090 domain-containing protein [Vibrio fluvialis]|nr:DUF1090 domain-containing protein [Vibrio fluvialis]ELL0573385.1 DUF1090 domain-containing protein [Vibrio fluvialis]ELL7085821.1 DUF1090 domain-containing protein [Vibrio fluvialis]ELL9329642.1 DUF1090 domain-containing protein [Vibrio fluvialis]ELV8594630.1 DUF1090 domain-containing protein [Vibrio fluvialis]
MTKKSIGVALLALLPVSVALANTPPLKGCVAKEQAIQQEIDAAKAHGNQRKLDGLNEALSQVREHCTEDGLLKERQAKVQEKQREVQQRRQELEEARASGKSDKIEKKMQKLDEANAELAEAMAELSK